MNSWLQQKPRTLYELLKKAVGDWTICFLWQSLDTAECHTFTFRKLHVSWPLLDWRKRDMDHEKCFWNRLYQQMWVVELFLLLQYFYRGAYLPNGAYRPLRSYTKRHLPVCMHKVLLQVQSKQPQLCCTATSSSSLHLAAHGYLSMLPDISNWGPQYHVTLAVQVTQCYSYCAVVAAWMSLSLCVLLRTFSSHSQHTAIPGKSWLTAQLGAYHSFLTPLLFSFCAHSHPASACPADVPAVYLWKCTYTSSSQAWLLCSQGGGIFSIFITASSCVCFGPTFLGLCMKTRAGLGIRSKNVTRPICFLFFFFFQAGISLQKQTCLILPSVSSFWLCPCLFCAPVWWWSLSY